MRTHSPARRGFTLIELLVVIAIIGLLVSILLPSLSNAKALARSAVCRSNLRNAGLGMATYQNEQRDALPNGWLRLSDGGGEQWIHQCIDAGIFLEAKTDSSDVPDDLTMLRCPDEDPAVLLDPWPGDKRSAELRQDPWRRKVLAMEKYDSGGNTEYWAHASYGINGGNVESNAFYGPSSSSLPHPWYDGPNNWKRRVTTNDFELPPGEVISLFDGVFQHVTGADYHSARHMNGTQINVLCVDGHAVSTDAEELSSVCSPSRDHWNDAAYFNRSFRPSHWYKRD